MQEKGERAMMTRKLSLDRGWRFHKGDFAENGVWTHTECYMAAKAGGAIGAAAPDYDRSGWEEIDLPHDWAVAGAFDEKWGPAQGYKERGKGWYAKTFRLDETMADQTLLIEFGGVATCCTVYLNGSVVGRNFSGYNSFTVDITDMALFGDRVNTLVVFVDADVIEGWWYEGSGIYRHVDLIVKNKVSVEHHGVFVHPEKQRCGEGWNTLVDTEIANDLEEQAALRLRSCILDEQGAVIAEASEVFVLEAGGHLTVRQNIPVACAELWDITSPRLYIMLSELYKDGELCDGQRNRFGYRTIMIDKDKGFFLNGRHVLLCGTCNHQDHAGVGVAVPDSVQDYRIRLLKEMGSNAYRCAHGNPSPELLEACDRHGMLVMDENRNFNTSADGISQVRNMVIRDRNHPCVIMYSIFNEEPLQGTPTGRKLAKRLDREIKRLDATRFTVGAMNNGVTSEGGACDALDLTGFNYITHTYDAFRGKFPHIPMVGSENDSAFQTRGVYRTDHAAHVIDCYDSECAAWGNTYRDGFKQIALRPHMLGLFIWTGFDYRGEPTPFEWPSISTQFGIMDTCGFKKDAFYLNQAFFMEEPMIHILPHWNFSDGEQVRVMAHTNCSEAELFLNGVSLGRKPVDRYEMAEWQVGFQPGELLMRGYREGCAVCEDMVRTAGKPCRLELSLSREYVYADCGDAVAVNVRAVDQEGIPVPDADQLVRFRCEGGEILGVGNGNPNSHEADKASERRLFHGLCQAIVRQNDGAAGLRIIAAAEGMETAEIFVQVKEREDKPVYIPTVRERYIGSWRTNVTLFDEKPSPDTRIEDSDMNNWVKAVIDRDEKFEGKTGYALYKASVEIPEGTKTILFRQVYGDEVEIYVDAEKKAGGRAQWGRSFEVDAPSGSRAELAVIIRSEQPESRGGIVKPVVMLD